MEWNERENKRSTWHFNEMHMMLLHEEPLSISLIQFMWQHERYSETSALVVQKRWQLWVEEEEKTQKHEYENQRLKERQHEMNWRTKKKREKKSNRGEVNIERARQSELRFDCPTYVTKVPLNEMIFFHLLKERRKNWRILFGCCCNFYLTSRLLNYIIIIIVMTMVVRRNNQAACKIT